jgi:hypothetical protein
MWSNAFTQALRQPVSAIYLDMGAYSKVNVDVFSCVNNQAALAQNTKNSVGLYSERRFMLRETSLFAGSVGILTNLGNIGINVKYSGFKNFNEGQIGVAYARSLGSKVDVGIQFNYYGYKVPGYISSHTLFTEIGAMIHLTQNLTTGIHLYNPVGGKFSATNEKLPSIYTMGLGYDVSDKFFISVEIVKEENFPVNANAGIQYNFIKQFFAKAGISSATSTEYAGVGVKWNIFRIDISVSYHPQLGPSPGLLLITDIDKH